MLRKTLFLFLLFVHLFTFSQENLRLISWNINELGEGKSEEVLDSVAQIVKDADIVAFQEVVTDEKAIYALSKLRKSLNNTGSRWEYIYSQPTGDSTTERYAFLWKTDNIQIVSNDRLIVELDSLVAREPYRVNFSKNGKVVTILNFHLRPDEYLAKPEVAALTDYLSSARFENATLVVGDFNLDEREPAFDALKNLGFTPAITFQRTTLKRKCDNNIYLSKAKDNIFYSPGIHKIQAHCSNVVLYCDNLSNILKLSDHLPIYMEFSY